MMKGIGLMSGTSIDGIDVALLDFKECSGKLPSMSLIAFDTVSIDGKLKTQIHEASDVKTSNTAKVSSLNFEMGRALSNAVSYFLKMNQINPDSIDFIASHGQTIHHLPNKDGDFRASTLQVGEPAILAHDHQIPIISDLRVMDMAAGGEGAPIVPILDYALFNNVKETYVLQNIGGIGNVTVIPKHGGMNSIIAFDTGPGNMMIDEAMHRFFNKHYDQSGLVAAKGCIHQELLDELSSHPYLKRKPPKTTGREMFGKAYVGKLCEKYDFLDPEDIVATFTEFTAYSISQQYESFICPYHQIDKVVVSGGGAKNQTLMRRIERLSGIPVHSFDELGTGISSDAKEAAAVALIGHETLKGRPSNVQSATGASKRVVLGSITRP